MSHLSSGEWHKRVPRDYLANLKFRRKLLDLCRHDREAQAAVIYACKNDFLAFTNLFILQFNPLSKTEIDRMGPFITWPYQEKILMMEPPVGKGILWCYEKDRTVVVEKSRDMGASWLFLIFQVWLCLFHDSVQALNISKSADAVDSKSKNSLFQKIRFILKHLPDWLKGQVEDTKLHFGSSRTSSEITGEASTGRAGTGGRATVIFIDEFSKIKEDTQVRTGTASVADCRFFNGTHEGVQTEFYNLTEAAKTGEVVKIQMHWTRHPRKNRQMYSWEAEMGRPRYWKYDEEYDELVETRNPVNPFPEDYPWNRTTAPAGGPHPGIRSVWYDTKSVEIGGPREVAMELDINPTGAASQFYDPLTIRRLRLAVREPMWTGDIIYDSDTAKPRKLDPHQSGPLSLWLAPGLTAAGHLCHVTPSKYVIGADLGTGSGATPSCLSIFDCVRGHKVGSYVEFWKDAKQMAWIAVALGYLFHDSSGEGARLAWETPGPGLAFGTEVLNEINYRRIHWKEEIFKDGLYPTDTPGWCATSGTKRSLHMEYRAALQADEFVNFDDLALEETLSYVYAGGSIEHSSAKKNRDAAAEGVNHGDRVVADALAWMMAKKEAGRVVDEEAVITYAVPNSIQGRREYREEQLRLTSHGWD